MRPGQLTARGSSVQGRHKEFHDRPAGPVGPDAGHVLRRAFPSRRRGAFQREGRPGRAVRALAGLRLRRDAPGKPSPLEPAHLLRGAFSGRVPVGASVPAERPLPRSCPLRKPSTGASRCTPFSEGFFFYLWAFKRGLHPLACFLAGAEFIFCAPYFLHIYAGHLPNLCTMIWAPLLFLAIDGALEKPAAGWCLLGIACRGDADPRRSHPVCLLHGDRGRASTWPLKPPGGRGADEGARLSFAVLTGRRRPGGGPDPARHRGRQGHPAGDRVCPMSLPRCFPSRRRTLLPGSSPAFFGDMVHFPYWGRWYPVGDVPLRRASRVFCWPSTPSSSGREGSASSPRPWRESSCSWPWGRICPGLGCFYAYLPGFRRVPRRLQVRFPGHPLRDPAFRHGARQPHPGRPSEALARPVGPGRGSRTVADHRHGHQAVIPCDASGRLGRPHARIFSNTGQSICRRSSVRRARSSEGRRICRPGPCRSCPPRASSSPPSCSCGSPTAGRPRCSLLWLSWSSFRGACSIGIPSGLPRAYPEDTVDSFRQKAGEQPHPEPVQPESRHVHGVA